MAEPDNTLMFEILKDIRKDVADVRKDVAGVRKEQDNHRTLLLLAVEKLRMFQQSTEEKFLGIDEKFHQVDAKFHQVDEKLLDIKKDMKAHKDDLEMMLKAELLGAMSNYRIRIENYVHERLSEKDE